MRDYQGRIYEDDCICPDCIHCDPVADECRKGRWRYPTDGCFDFVSREGESEMKDQQIIWINNPKIAWKWAMEWVEEAKTGNHYPVKHIIEAAKKIKDRFCTDGLWSPGSELVYNYLREAADMAQSEYEDAQPGME